MNGFEFNDGQEVGAFYILILDSKTRRSNPHHPIQHLHTAHVVITIGAESAPLG